MPRQGIIFRVLIASPSDCIHERKVISEVVHEWNAVHSLDQSVVVEPVLWETHSRPELGDRPQAIINRQLVESCDMLIGAFWTRFGTPTGEADSGTAEEIEAFRAAGKPVLLYFSSVPVVPESLDRAQYDALLAYRNRLEDEGLYWSYESLADFRGQLRRHFAGTMIEQIREYAGRSNHAASVGSAVGEERHNLRSLAFDFESFLRRIEAEWRAERDSGPFTVDEGKRILDQAAQDVLNFRSMIDEDMEGVADVLDDASRRLRAIQRHRTYLDGGASFRAFWTEGDQILELLRQIPGRLNESASPESDY